jgi:RNA polymerase sigma-70 factor (ECF subfamily)
MVSFDSILLNKLKRGDHNAFEKIFEQYSEQLYQFSFSYLKSKEASEDIVQEVFIKVWNNRKQIKTNTSFQSYLFTITLNAVRKHFNKLAKSNELKHDLLIGFSGKREEFDEFSDYQSLLDKLEDLINQMPQKRKEAFIKKKIEGKSLKEISEEMSITTKAVEYHITEAMNFLRSRFEELKLQGLIFYHLFLQVQSEFICNRQSILK